MIKIWGTSFSLIGDLIMSLPQLNYFKNKYKKTYIYFVIHKKISYCAPLFFNHPLIDKIHISGEWSSFNYNDYKIAKECDVITTKIDDVKKKILDRTHDDIYWYNSRTCIDETARMSNLTDFDEYITNSEKIPKLYKWFDEGFEPEQKKAAYTYNKKLPFKHNYELNKSIALWPFAGYGRSKNRNPSVDWWVNLTKKLIDKKINVYHFGYYKEPQLSDNMKYYHNLTKLSFFEQIKISLGTKVCLGTDSGSMWVLSAYSHPTITLLTNWADNHIKNFKAFLPPNKNGQHIFCENSFKDLSVDKVLEAISSTDIGSANKINKIINFFKKN